ncbi:MXAN_6230/SCO0854 family RING domain-containing protein [Hyalangium gracile]|uniref:MXAN_6230/SCO0854 family RING domain-containing protein n=1 Tax=Hyalangium gracile TaxID=394092 RepID=UPI001CC979D6|nr:MXAN_6230/SCO0854 family RING domain-containing protein [Hyalangium gracile]
MAPPELDVPGAVSATAALLLRKTSRVFVPTSRAASTPSLRGREGVRALETDLLALGYTLSGPLQDALAALTPETLAQVGRFVFDTLAEHLGRNRPFVPLFTNFPHSVPEDTHSFYMQRVLVWLFQEAEHPCIQCGNVTAVQALDPCAHVVCQSCFDPREYGACPICHRRVTAGQPYFQPVTHPSTQRLYVRREGRMTRLSLGTDLEAASREVMQRLLSRATVLRPDELDSVSTFVSHFRLKVLGWLPARIPVKETMAHVLGSLLRQEPEATADVLSGAASHLKTATDFLRVLVAWAGGNPDLTVRVPLESPPRPMRRAVLKAMEALPPLNLTEDVHRYPGLWKAMSGQLHVFERWRQHPNVALAFTTLRGTVLVPETDFGQAMLAQARAHPDDFLSRPVEGGVTLRFRSWSSRVEELLGRRDVSGALRLLRQRPGELLRRLDHVARTALVAGDGASQERELAASLEAVAPRAAPALLLTAAAHLRRRNAPFSRRIFFPKGEATHAWGTEDRRPLLSGDTIGQLVGPLERELLRRAERLPALPQALLDEALSDLLVPLAEKTASRALVAVPRGSVLDLPQGEHLRFFVHWTEPKQRRVDLDLSVALYDAKWWLVDLCDYTNLRLAGGGAVHSGDVTSGPAPIGGAEFLDVHTSALLARGVRYAVPVVFSFNSVPFDRMEDAFAGFMVRDGNGGRHFDASTVEQRFDLQGSAKISLPLVIDLEARKLCWVDVKVPTDDPYHSVDVSRGELAHFSKDALAYFGTGARPTLWELACLHAAARTRTVHVRRRNGRVAVLTRAPNEDAGRFLRRLRHLEDAREAPRLELGRAPTFFAGLSDEPSLPDGSEGYALRFRHTEAERVQRLAAGELVSALRP